MGDEATELWAVAALKRAGWSNEDQHLPPGWWRRNGDALHWHDAVARSMQPAAVRRFVDKPWYRSSSVWAGAAALLGVLGAGIAAVVDGRPEAGGAILLLATAVPAMMRAARDRAARLVVEDARAPEAEPPRQ